jgi:uncharacterized damage-inducible protein DinB
MSRTVAAAPAVSEEFQAYIAKIHAALGERDPVEVLRETPAAVRAAVRGLTAEQFSIRERPGKWSVRHVVQHLADAELVGAFRYRMVLAHERPELPAYDQDLWADRLGYEESDPEAALALFTVLRGANLGLITRTTAEERQRAMRHPERGDETLEETARLYAGHDIVHRRQIARIRAAIGAAPADSGV